MSYRLTNEQKIYLYFKRLIDLIGSTIGIVLCAVFFWWWLFLVNAIATKGHPVFASRRVGRDNKPFDVYKFRSMKYDADPTVAAFGTNTDSMITSFGQFLRKSSLDETLQLINIFLGQMSFIGPRPLIDNETDHITIVLREQNGSNKIKPGLSGYAQINGRAKMDPETKGKMDGYYYEHVSFFFDLSIFFSTFTNLYRGNKLVNYAEKLKETKLGLWLKSLSESKRMAISASLLTLATVICFAGGIPSSNAALEQSTKEIASFIANNPECDGYFGIEARTNYSETNIDLCEYTYFAKQINNLYSETYPYAASVVYNANKEQECVVDSLGIFGSQLSFIPFTLPTNHVDEENNVVLDQYNFKLMFPNSDISYSGLDNYTFLSDVQAKYLIDNGFASSYETLIGLSLSVKINHLIFSWKISNIYYADSPVAKVANSILGNYLLCYRSIPGSSSYRESLDNLSFLFVLGQSEYLNLNNLNTMLYSFKNDKFEIKPLTSRYDDTKITSATSIVERIVHPSSNQTLSDVMMIVSLVIFFAFIYSYTMWNLYGKLINYLVILGLQLLITIIFVLLSIILGSALIASKISLFVMMAFIVATFVFNFTLFTPLLFRKEKHSND